MSSNPYENEPGFETANDEGDKKNQKDYVAKVRSFVVFPTSLLTRVYRFVTKLYESLLYNDLKNTSVYRHREKLYHMPQSMEKMMRWTVLIGKNLTNLR